MKMRIHALCAAVALMLMLSSGVVRAAAQDDSALFIHAFNAYQQKDYLLVLDTCDQLLGEYPDSPLRDVTLLLTARAGYRSGDNERAARTISRFNTEFPGSSLRTSVEEELTTLAEQHKKGERLAADPVLHAAALKIRTEHAAREREAREQAERERLRLERIAKESIKVLIALQDGSTPVKSGDTASLSLDITNSGKNSEEFLLTVSANEGYSPYIVEKDIRGEKIERIRLAAGASFNGRLMYRMPNGIVDGHRSGIAVKVVSVPFNDVTFQKTSITVGSAPLIRTVARLGKSSVQRGEKLPYRVALLNAGSMAATDVTATITLPAALKAITVPAGCRAETGNGSLTCTISGIASGTITDLQFDVKVLDTASAGQVRGQVEVISRQSAAKELFTGSSAVIAP